MHKWFGVINNNLKFNIMNNHKLICQYCNESFEAKRSDAKYCSNSCKTMASNARLNGEGHEIISLRFDTEDLQTLRDEAARIPMGLEKYIITKSLTQISTVMDFKEKMRKLQKENDELKVSLSYFNGGFSADRIVLKCVDDEYNTIADIINKYYNVITGDLAECIKAYIYADEMRANQIKKGNY